MSSPSNRTLRAILRQLLLVNTASTHYTEAVYKGTGRTWSAGVGNGSETTYGVADKFFIFDSTAGAARLAVDTTGDVGIGTTSPTFALDVKGSTAIYSEGTGAGFAFKDRAGGTNPFWEWYSTGNVARFFLNTKGDLIGINTSGQVGIGTTTPAATLEVNGGAQFDSNVTIEGPSPWVDVTSYGADPSGAMDSAAAINNAIQACPVAASSGPPGPSGCTIFFPPGSYEVKSAITISKNTASGTQLQNVRLVGAGAASVAGSGQTSGGTSEIFNGLSAGGFFLINVTPPSGSAVPMNGIVISDLGFRDPQRTAYGAINLHDTEYFAVDDVSCRQFTAGTCVNLYGDSSTNYTQFGSIKDIFTGTTLCGICTTSSTPSNPAGFVSEVTILGGNISCVDPANNTYPLAGSVGISFDAPTGQKSGENQVFGASVNDCLTGYNLIGTGATHLLAKFEQTLTGNTAGTCGGSSPQGDIGCGTGLVIENVDSSTYTNGNVITFQSSKAGVGIEIPVSGSAPVAAKEQIVGGTFESNYTADICVNSTSLPSTMVLVAAAALQASQACPSTASNAVTGSQFPAAAPTSTAAGTGVAIVAGSSVVSWSAGSGAPTNGSCTIGSLYSNTSGSPSALYVCTSAGTWTGLTVP